MHWRSCLIDVNGAFIKDNPKKFEMGFSLIELLIVVTIITILASLFLPMLQKSLGLAHQISCTNNMNNLGTTAFIYTTDNNGYLPSITSWDRVLAQYLDWRIVSHSEVQPGTKTLCNQLNHGYLSCFYPTEQTPCGVFFCSEIKNDYSPYFPIRTNYCPSVGLKDQIQLTQALSISGGKSGGWQPIFEDVNTANRISRILSNSVILTENKSYQPVPVSVNFRSASTVNRPAYSSSLIDVGTRMTGGSSYIHGGELWFGVSNFLFVDGSIMSYLFGTVDFGYSQTAHANKIWVPLR
jgi:prepilin-type N-terminal cleavage/methylation domain-containing protein